MPRKAKGPDEMKSNNLQTEPTNEQTSAGVDWSLGSPHNPWLTKAQAAAYLGRSIAWMTRAQDANLITYIKPGRAPYFLKSDLDKFLLQHVHPAKEGAKINWTAKKKTADTEGAPILPTLEPENTVEVIINGELFKAYKVKAE